MSGNQPPRIPAWLLRHFGSGPSIEAVLGDLNERYLQGRSGLWYWQQVAVAIAVSTLKDIRSHKLLALRALIVGWAVFWFLFNGFLYDPLNILAMSYRQFMFHWSEGQLYFKAFCTLGVCTVGVLSGWTVGRLHRRKVSMVLAHAVSVLLNWIVQGLTKHPESVGVYPPYFWMNIAILTLGILFGGVLCASRQDTTLQQGVSF